MNDGWVRKRCPYCFEEIEFWVDPQERDEFVIDCEVCCRPWRVQVMTDGEFRTVLVDRAQ